jgi:hypothetical protein
MMNSSCDFLIVGLLQNMCSDYLLALDFK